MPGYTGHLAGLKSDALNIGETTHKKLENMHSRRIELGGQLSTAEYVSSGKIGMMPKSTLDVSRHISPEPERHRINLGSNVN